MILSGGLTKFSPAPLAVFTRTTLNFLLSSIPGKEPFLSLMVKVFLASSQLKVIVE